jgi:hypothetical protein
LLRVRDEKGRLCGGSFSVTLTLTMQDSKPIIDFLKDLTTAASKFGSFQSKAFYTYTKMKKAQR